MKLDLVSSVSLDSLNKGNKNSSRRQFLKYMGIGLTLPFLTKLAYANSCPNMASYSSSLAQVGLSDLSLDKTLISSGESTSGYFSLVNDNLSEETGSLKLTLIDEWNLQEPSNIYMNVSMPPRSIHQYHFSSGPALVTDRSVSARFRVTSSIDTIENSNLVVRV